MYNCLNNRGTACKVKGWNLKWISKQSDEAAPLTQALEKEKEARKLARQQRLDEIRAEHKAATQNRREERMRKKQISKLEKRIATWKKHLEATKSKEKIEKKIRELEAQKRVFEEKCI